MHLCKCLFLQSMVNTYFYIVPECNYICNNTFWSSPHPLIQCFPTLFLDTFWISVASDSSVSTVESLLMSWIRCLFRKSLKKFTVMNGVGNHCFNLPLNLTTPQPVYHLTRIPLQWQQVFYKTTWTQYIVPKIYAQNI